MRWVVDGWAAGCSETGSEMGGGWMCGGWMCVDGWRDMVDGSVDGPKVGKVACGPDVVAAGCCEMGLWMG